MDKNELIHTLQLERAAWDTLLKEVGVNRMTVPEVVGDWTIKDVIAHIIAWEQRPVEWLVAARRGDAPLPAAWPKDLSEEETNAWIYHANRNRPLADILDQSRQVNEKLMQELEAISEEELIDSALFDWLNGNSLADSIPGNSYEHYQHHAQDIRNWLKLEKVH